MLFYSSMDLSPPSTSCQAMTLSRRLGSLKAPGNNNDTSAVFPDLSNASVDLIVGNHSLLAWLLASSKSPRTIQQDTAAFLPDVSDASVNLIAISESLMVLLALHRRQQSKENAPFMLVHSDDSIELLVGSKSFEAWKAALL